jgi:tetratricopeptide (TPR) repeat protein
VRVSVGKEAISMGFKVRGLKVTYRYLTFGFLTLLISTSLAFSAFGGQFEDAVFAYQRGDFANAYRLFKPLAEQGVPRAQFNLGVMYEIGRGVPQDYSEAEKWYRKAAEQEVPAARYNLGVMYFKGRGVPQDYSEAEKWYRKAAEQGVPRAQFNLGLMYADGLGVPQDYVLAHMWINIATSRYPSSENENQEWAAKIRDLAASTMTPAQIAEAERLAQEWKPKKDR